MPTLTGPEVFQLAYEAFKEADPSKPEHVLRANATYAAGVAFYESGWRTDAKGDTTITTQKWGPSVGLWQIRSLNADYGTGRHRDERANTDPVHNARAMVSISGGGDTWTPWSVTRSDLPQGRPEDVAAKAAEVTQEVAGLMDISVTDFILADGASPIGIGGLPGLIAGIVGSPIDSGGAIIDSVGGTIGNAVGGILDPLEAVGQLLSNLLDPNFWKRLGLGALGVVLVLGGLAVALGDVTNVTSTVPDLIDKVSPAA